MKNKKENIEEGIPHFDAGNNGKVKSSHCSYKSFIL